jgi:hypothetical protein
LTVVEFFVGWAALLVVFTVMWSRIPRHPQDECPPHIWDACLMDNGTWALFCSKCGEPPVV